MLLVGAGPTTPSGGAFSPASLAGLVGWWDFTSAAYLRNASSAQPAAGETIATAIDRKPPAHDAAQATDANRPVYQTAGGANSKPFAEFLTADKFLDFSTVTFSGPFTMVVGLQRDNVSSTHGILGATTSSSAQLRTNAAGTVITFRTPTGSARQFTVGTAVNTTARILVVRRDSNGQVRVWVNGSESSTGTIVDTTPATYNRIGRETSLTPYQGRMYHVAIYDAALMGTQLDQVAGWMATQLGLSWTAVSDIDQGLLSATSFDVMWSRLTGAESLTMLKAEGYAVAGATIDSNLNLRPDGVLNNLHYNGGAGFLSTETSGAFGSPARYVGKLLKDPGQADYTTSTTYHQAPWAIKDQLRADWNTGNTARTRLLQISAAMTTSRIAQIISPNPTTSTGSGRATKGLPWTSTTVEASSGVAFSNLMFGMKNISWTLVDGQMPTLRTAATVESHLSGWTAGRRVVRTYADVLPREVTSGNWQYALFDGRFAPTPAEPGLWMDVWQSEIIGTTEDKGLWWQWCEAWQARVDGGAAPLDWVLVNGEYGQDFYGIKTGSDGNGIPDGQPGKFDGAGNAIVADSRWATSKGAIGIEDSAGNDLWHMNDSAHASYWDKWSASSDERVMLFNAWCRDQVYQQYATLVGKAKEFAAFANTKFVCYDMGMFASTTYPCGPASVFNWNPIYHGRGLGDICSVSIYGTSLKDVYKFGTGTQAKPTQTAWTTFQYEMKLLRAQQAASTLPKFSWLMTKSHPLQHSSYKGSSLWDEQVLHALLAGESCYVAFYPDASTPQGDWERANAVIAEFDAVLPSATQVSLLAPQVEYADLYVASTVDCNGKFYTRITPDPSASLSTSNAGSTLQVTVSRGAEQVTLGFTTGSVVAPGNAVCMGGIWVQQTRLF